MKNDSERVRTWLQLRLRRNPPAAEHIIRMENYLIIEIDVRKCVEAFKNQIHMFAREHCGIGLKCSLILPVRQTDPLQVELIVLIERIRNYFVSQKIGLKYYRNMSELPLF